MLRYRADVRTLAYLALYFALLITLWCVPLPAAASAALIALTCVVSWLNAVSTHNVVHSPIWRSRLLNRLTQLALTLAYGFPISDYVPGHNLSHHRYTQSRRDVMRTTKVRFRWQLLNLVTFFFVVNASILRANAAYARFARTRNPTWTGQRLLEICVGWGTTLALAVVNLRWCLLTVLLPHLVAVYGIVTVNYLQHDGCDPDHPYNHSRNFVGKLFNWVTLNNGYHGMHHEEPGLHWSLLAKAHEERIKPFLDPRLDEPSTFLYVWRTFILPRPRLRFDGAPVVFEDGPDQDWIHAEDPGRPQNAEAFSS